MTPGAGRIPGQGAQVTLADLLREGVRHLRAAGIEGAERDARALLAASAGLVRGRLGLHLPDPAPPDLRAVFLGHVASRAARRPVARILGERLFWDRRFEITDDVLDPRPETETLVAAALEAPFATLLDLGTGSGILAVTLLAERAGATGLATDISAAALRVAARNAAAHGVAGRLRLAESDWFAAVAGRFELIVSNPPYIAAVEMTSLAPEVLGHDPHLALTDHGDGLSAYRRIAAAAPAHLAPGGRLLVEIGAAQGPAVAALFRGVGLDDVTIRPDLDGRDRVVIGRGR